MKRLYCILLVLVIVWGNVCAQDGQQYKVRIYDDEEELVDTIMSFVALEEVLHLFGGFNYPTLDHGILGDSVSRLFNDTVEFKIYKAKFDSSKYESVEFYDDLNHIGSVNGKKVWGTDGGIPQWAIEKMEFKRNDRVVNIPTVSYIDLFEPNIGCYYVTHSKSDWCYTKGYITDRNKLIISMSNSDAAGGYEVIFVFNMDGELENRAVGHGF
ncbi:MAG: hypothetical protein JKX95_05545 [Bacteroidia bacterium]|nr:hypothetical protein [Bacteroidia bacterium]